MKLGTALGLVLTVAVAVLVGYGIGYNAAPHMAVAASTPTGLSSYERGRLIVDCYQAGRPGGGGRDSLPFSKELVLDPCLMAVEALP